MASELGVQTIQHTNGTDALTIDSSGRVAQPALPYVMVTLQSGATVTPNNVVPFNNVVSSRGIVWDTSAYSFTAPVTGIYSFSGNVRLNANRDYVFWAVADGSGSILQGSKLVIAHGASAGFTSASGSCLASLTASSSYKIIFNDSTGSSVGMSGGQTFMDVHLVG